MEYNTDRFWDNFDEVWHRVQRPPDLFTPPPPAPPEPSPEPWEESRGRSRRIQLLARDCLAAAARYRRLSAKASQPQKKARLMQLARMEQRRGQILMNLSR